jgi:hypothetical protein
MIIWTVWEANSQPPMLFTDQRDAYKYRATRMTRVRHQVYIAATVVSEGDK